MTTRPASGAARPRARTMAACRLAVLALCLAAGTAPAATLDEARTLADSGRTAEALATVDAVLSERAEDVPALLLRGVLLTRLGRSDEAIDTFNALARARPDLPEPHNNLAVLYAAQGRYEEARAALLEALRLQPDYDVAHENLGDVYAKLAQLSYARAHQINPANEAAANKADAAAQLLQIPSPTASLTPPAAPAPAPVPAAATPPAPAAPAATACAAITGISPAERADGVAEWLRGRGVSARISEETSDGALQGYRVLVAPLPDAAAARARIGELRRLGVRDLIILTDGEHRNGISLGVFTRRSGAERRARDLAALGVDTLIEERHTRTVTGARINARGPFVPAAFARAFPDLHVQMEDCP